jgi:hypothetical protein
MVCCTVLRKGLKHNLQKSKETVFWYSLQTGTSLGYKVVIKNEETHYFFFGNNSRFLKYNKITTISQRYIKCWKLST